LRALSEAISLLVRVKFTTINSLGYSLLVG
jgi:hypothetical protein